MLTLILILAMGNPVLPKQNFCIEVLSRIQIFCDTIDFKIYS